MPAYHSAAPIVPAWATRRCLCCAGPETPPFEERHDFATIALVRSGRFTYRGAHGRRLLEAGSLLLGNAHAHFECSHEDSVGDLCLAVHFAPDLFAEAAAAHGIAARAGFAESALPPLDDVLPAVMGLLRQEDWAPVRLLHSVFEIVSKRRPDVRPPSTRDNRAIRLAIDLIECSPSAMVTLDDLAATAGMSRYHFLRCFRQTMGVTPHQFQLSRRMARFAERLGDDNGRISDMVFDAGFGDLSTFNKRFRATFGVSPRRWRKRH